MAGAGTSGTAGDGGLGTSRKCAARDGVAIDGSGNLGWPTWCNRRVQMVAADLRRLLRGAMTAGDIYTVAGDGTGGYAGDGGPATSAELATPTGVAWTAPATWSSPTPSTAGSEWWPPATGTYYGRP